MILYYLVGIIFLGIEYLVLKNVSDTINENVPFRVWHLIFLILVNSIPYLNIIVFAIFSGVTIGMLENKTIIIKFNPDNKILKFLNKEL